MSYRKISDRPARGLIVLVLLLILTACRGGTQTEETAPAEPVRLRLGVALTPQELVDFQEAVAVLDEAHPEYDIVLETAPQQGAAEKISTELAANNLPDVLRVGGLQVHQWLRQGAFLDLGPFIEESGLNLDDFFDGPLEQFMWQDSLWGLPDTAAPDVLFYNKTMFDSAGLAYPTDDWTFADVRAAAVQLTLDSEGRNSLDPDFDHQAIEQWGWNGSITYFWQRHLVQGWGADFCANDDCTLMNFTAPETIQAVEWWASFTHDDWATLFDPYGGSQTGIPGDPFIAGKAAMGYNGFFAVGQLNDAGNIDYDIAQPPRGIVTGERHTPLSTNGYVIAANSEHPEEAWALVMALTEPQFLAETWGAPGHSVPARISVADSVINRDHPPANQEAIVAAMAYGEVFKPYTASAFEVNAKTAALFQAAMSGEMDVTAALTEIETIANETLARDREP